jgi:uncharacterized membrane protein
MEDQNKIIDELSKKIERLMQQNQFVHTEILQLQTTVQQLKHKQEQENEATIENSSPIQEAIIETAFPEISETVKTESQIKAPAFEEHNPIATTSPTAQRKSKSSSHALEEFIGTNLLNKVGIAVLVVGIGFGTKYAIDHQLLSPLTRIILGYISSIVLLAVALKLKKKYESFSAVLLSGGMAALYFVTYAAYDFYDLIPQIMAFILMVLFTAFTCFAAIQYNIQIIAVIGLVGAYAVPFLLSNDSGRVVVLFSYVSIINLGILILAFKKYWKSLYYLAFSLTWIIYASWFMSRYNEQEHLWISLIFSTIFFVIFYTTFLAYKLLRREALEKVDIIMLMLNSFVYFGYGYSAIDFTSSGNQFLGIFTVFTAALHFIGAVIIYKQQGQHKDIFYLVAGMVLVFLTLAVPVQLDGHWVTLVWAAEALLLFWIGRVKRFPVYEKLSYVLVLLAFGSLVEDWDNYYGSNYSYDQDTIKNIPLFINIQFFDSLWVAAAFGFILLLDAKKSYANPFEKGTLLRGAFMYGLPALFAIVVYFAFFKEIQVYWDQRYTTSIVPVRNSEGEYNVYDFDLLKFQTLWLINYSALFAIILSVVNLRFIKSDILAYASVILNALVITAFLFAGLLAASSLRTSFLEQVNAAYYNRGIYHIVIRYIGLLFIVPLIFSNYWYLNKTNFFTKELQRIERVLFHLVVLTLLSSELVHILNMMNIHDSFKLALSILWGVYALFLIVIGLWKNQKHIRITAIVLFGITLVKLFLYDMADMSTIAKTIVMMILGVLLLTASFLYNKYKRSNESE